MKWTEPTTARMERIAKLLRWQDRLEVLYSHGKTPDQAVTESWQNSQICRCIGTDEGTAVGICGVNGSLIWLLGTDELLEHRRDRLQFIREGRRWVDSLFRDHGYRLLENWALANNVTTLRWLYSMGFTIDTPAPLGHSAQLFCHFWREG